MLKAIKSSKIFLLGLAFVYLHSQLSHPWPTQIYGNVRAYRRCSCSAFLFVISRLFLPLRWREWEEEGYKRVGSKHHHQPRMWLWPIAVMATAIVTAVNSCLEGCKEWGGFWIGIFKVGGRGLLWFIPSHLKFMFQTTVSNFYETRNERRGS